MIRSQVPEIIRRMKSIADPERATHAQRFFRTGPGEYGEGDRFLGIRVPETRNVARHFKDLPLEQCEELLDSPLHEIRLLALIIMVEQFKRADANDKKRIYESYMNMRASVNSWDLVDVSAPAVVGAYLEDRSRAVLFKLAGSTSLWDRRIAVLATFHFIRMHDFSDAEKLCASLLTDNEDLIHKAVGWMLREIGNRDRSVEETFLSRYYKEMPRTMLRYAIEKFPQGLRKRYMLGKI